MDAPFETLVAMGFKAGRVRAALKATSGDTDSAIEMLLGEAGDDDNNNGNSNSNNSARSADQTSKSDDSDDDDNNNDDASDIPQPSSKERSTDSLVVASISQYTVDRGRSACTCIALKIASLFLEEPAVPIQQLANILQLAILEGVRVYQKLQTSGLGDTVEHMSAEEVLKAPSKPFPTLRMSGEIQQGLITSDPNHPLNFKTMLGALQHRLEWVCVLITKTPESVVACLPPKTKPAARFLLMDSHPRPQVQLTAAYASIQPSLSDLCSILLEVFPPTELGQDIPDMMATMYNSFDLYPLVAVPPPSSPSASTASSSSNK